MENKNFILNNYFYYNTIGKFLIEDLSRTFYISLLSYKLNCKSLPIGSELIELL